MSDPVADAASARELAGDGLPSPHAGEDLTILVLAPSRNDAGLTATALCEAGLQAVIFPNLASLCAQARESCGALLVAEEALNPSQLPLLGDLIEEQPSWSDIPISIITSAGELSSDRRQRLIAWAARGNVTLIERPFRMGTFLSTMEVALRSRRRQYYVRDLLRQNFEKNEDLEFTLQAGHLGTWKLDLRDHTLTCSTLCKQHYGVRPDEPFTHLDLLALIHPEDRTKMTGLVSAAIREAADYQSEYRIITPQGECRWLQVRGRVATDARGQPLHLAGITQNVTERKHAEEALAQQTRALKDADQRKDEFLAMLAHELRNPLASVGNAATLLKSSDLVEDRTWAATVIERQTAQLARLIEDLLDVSRISTGKIRLRRDTVDVASILDRAVESVRPLLSDRKHLLTCEYARGELWLHADPTRIEQIVLNLLSNSAKYTPADGHITLRASCEGGEISIAVKDNGIGIDPERLPQMFELFAQGERSIARSEGGLGIGLTIVRKLAEMHGGRVDAYSAGLDRGSTFTVRLPATLAPHARAQSPVVAPAAPAEGTRVLVVDDNVDTATVLSRLLKRAGYIPTTAHDGTQALKMAAADPPDVIILDIGLPGVDGYEVALRLRREPRFAQVLIIATSGYGRDEDLQRSRAAGFDHHLIKPVDFSEINRLIRRSTQGQEASVANAPGVGG